MSEETHTHRWSTWRKWLNKSVRRHCFDCKALQEEDESGGRSTFDPAIDADHWKREPYKAGND